MLRIKSSALFVAILVSMLIGIFCFCLILVSHVNRVQVQQDRLIKKLHLNVRSGVNLLLSKTDFVSFNEEKQIDLYGEGRDTVYLNRKHWGIYDIGIVQAKNGEITRSKVFQYGYPIDKKNAYTIWLTDQNRPLCISGKTSITGNCYLPKAGIKSGFVNSVGYAGIKYVEGEVLDSEEALPEFNNTVLERLVKWNKNPDKVANSENAEVHSFIKSDTILNRSFFEPTLLINSKEPIILDGINLEGNVIITSASSIEIKANCSLKNIQLYAPYIKIKERFKGSIQAFVTDSLSTGESCEFNYPSVFGLIKEGNIGRTLCLKLGAKNRFKGIIFSHTKEKDIEETKVIVGKESVVDGQIFCRGYLELQQDIMINGSVACNRFLVVSGIIYSNYILDATINFSRLSPYYVSAELFKTNKNKQIISWLK